MTSKLDEISIDCVLKLPIAEQVLIVHEHALKDFNKAVEDCGKSQVMFIAFDHSAAEMLYEWSEYQKAIKKEHGVDVPDLVDGTTVSVVE